MPQRSLSPSGVASFQKTTEPGDPAVHDSKRNTLYFSTQSLIPRNWKIPREIGEQERLSSFTFLTP